MHLILHNTRAFVTVSISNAEGRNSAAPKGGFHYESLSQYAQTKPAHVSNAKQVRKSASEDPGGETQIKTDRMQVFNKWSDSSSV